MSEIGTLLARTPNYIRRFGVLSGLQLLAQIEGGVRSKADTMNMVTVPGWPAPVWLRPTVADRATFWQCVTRAQYDFSAFPQSSRLLQSYQAAVDAGREPLIIDCGANIGLASVWYANRLPKARIVAIEPDRANFAVLEKNIAPYGDRITAIQGGIWSHSTHLRITNPEGGAAALRVEEVTGAEPGLLRGYTIDELCTLAKDDSPLIVKIDIEGAQGALFADNVGWVGRSGLIVLELDDWQMPWQGTSRNFFKCLSNYPFDYLLNGESIFCFRDYSAALPTTSR